MRNNWENVMLMEASTGYAQDGHCNGTIEHHVPVPSRLRWEIPAELVKVIDSQLEIARALANDVDMHIFNFGKFGKGAAKKHKVSPDAFIQMAFSSRTSAIRTSSV